MAIAARLRREDGVTLIELLVVILVYSIVAAITLPSLLNQRTKSYDAVAKSAVRNAQKAEEIEFLDNGAYTNLNATLASQEASLANANVLTATLNQTGGYTISVTSKAKTAIVYSITKTSPTATVIRTCSVPGKGGCHLNSSW